MTSKFKSAQHNLGMPNIFILMNFLIWALFLPQKKFFLYKKSFPNFFASLSSYQNSVKWTKLCQIPPQTFWTESVHVFAGRYGRAHVGRLVLTRAGYISSTHSSNIFLKIYTFLGGLFRREGSLHAGHLGVWQVRKLFLKKSNSQFCLFQGGVLFPKRFRSVFRSQGRAEGRQVKAQWVFPHWGWGSF